MTTTRTHIAGKFVWHELATPDLARAQAFYGALFGWTFKDVSHDDMPYHLVEVSGADIAGIWPIDEAHAGKVPPHWGAYLSVEDVDATARLAVEAGGKVVAGPHDIPEAGRMVVLQDPTGAHLTAYRDRAGDRADRMPGGGEFCWDELQTTDVEAAKAFYHKVFGLTTQAMEADAGIFTFHRPDGNMTASLMAAQPGMPSHWASYVAVESLEASRAKAAELGATVVVPEIPVPGIGRFAVLQDPTGAYVNIFEGAAD